MGLLIQENDSTSDLSVSSSDHEFKFRLLEARDLECWRVWKEVPHREGYDFVGTFEDRPAALNACRGK